MPAERWFLVGKSLRTPFDDGSTVLLRELVCALPKDLLFSYFGDARRPLRESAVDEVIEMPPMGHSPSLWVKVRVMAALLDPQATSAAAPFLLYAQRDHILGTPSPS